LRMATDGHDPHITATDGHHPAAGCRPAKAHVSPDNE
jgi:hypothetical protein